MLNESIIISLITDGLVRKMKEKSDISIYLFIYFYFINHCHRKAKLEEGSPMFLP